VLVAPTIVYDEIDKPWNSLLVTSKPNSLRIRLTHNTEMACNWRHPW